MSDDNPRNNRPPSPALLVRAEPLDGSGFEAEVPEPGYEERE